MNESWPFLEAQKVADLLVCKGKDHALFACGFGPSGQPHIGTIAEMIRTQMVRRAFTALTGLKSRVILFADDLDGLRKVPGSVPEPERLDKYVEHCTPVAYVPNPFLGQDGDGGAQSFSDRNIQELVRLLSRCGIEQGRDYELVRAQDFYWDNLKLPGMSHVKIAIAERAREVAEIVTRDYKPERRAEYCPFLLIERHHDGIYGTNFSLKNWAIDWKEADIAHDMQRVPFVKYDIPYLGGLVDVTAPIMLGYAKLQWKVDWPARWMALDVDYEMHGKDLLSSATVGDEICRLFGYQPPVHMMYELFLDDQGKKISKSVGNGLEADEWLDYAPIEALQWFLFQEPRRARKLTWRVIPETVDLYVEELAKEVTASRNEFLGEQHRYDDLSAEETAKIGWEFPQDSAIWFIHDDQTSIQLPPVRYSMLLNLAGIANTQDEAILLRYLAAYDRFATYDDCPMLRPMVRGALRYYERFVLPTKIYATPTPSERAVLVDLHDGLKALPAGVTETELRGAIFEIGKRHYEPKRLREYFAMLYRVLMGQESGPQFHQFVAVIGIAAALELITARLG